MFGWLTEMYHQQYQYLGHLVPSIVYLVVNPNDFCWIYVLLANDQHLYALFRPHMAIKLNFLQIQRYCLVQWWIVWLQNKHAHMKLISTIIILRKYCLNMVNVSNKCISTIYWRHKGDFRFGSFWFQRAFQILPFWSTFNFQSLVKKCKKWNFLRNSIFSILLHFL